MSTSLGCWTERVNWEALKKPRIFLISFEAGVRGQERGRGNIFGGVACLGWRGEEDDDDRLILITNEMSLY